MICRNGGSRFPLIWSNPMRRNRRYVKLSQQIVARYYYVDQRGKLLYQVRRHHPKGFSVLTSSGKTLTEGGRFRRVPYRLVELLAADPKQIVFVVEGEKDVDRLWSENRIATCNAFGGGIGKWKLGHSRPLRDRDVVILPDNDTTGVQHARYVAKSLRNIAKSVRVLMLPGLPRKGDVSDWLEAGHTINELEELVENTPPQQPDMAEWLPERDWNPLYDSDYNRLCSAASIRRRIFRLPVSATEKLLLVILCEYFRPPQRELALCMRLTVRRVRQLIAGLVEKKFLTVWQTHRRNHYSVNIPYSLLD